MTGRTSVCAIFLLAALTPAPAAPPAAAVAPDWVERDGLGGGYHAPPESLEGAWQAALAIDRLLEAERWNASAAWQRLCAARAQRGLGVDLDTSYMLRSDETSVRLHLPGPPPTSYLAPLAQDHGVGARAGVDLPLYTSGRIDRAIDAAAAEATAAALQVEDARADLKMQVAEAFVAVLRAQQERAVRQTAVRSLDAHRQVVEVRHRHEQVPQNDLLAAEVALADARQREIEAHNALDVARAAYNRHLGRPLTAAVRLQELSRAAAPEGVEELSALAQRNRRQLARLSARAAALRHQAHSLRASALPQVHLRGEYHFEENRYRHPEGMAAVGVGVGWNLFDAGRTRHEAAALAHQAEQLLRLRADLQSQIALDVRRRWLDVHQTQRRLEVTPQAIAQAEEHLRIVRQRYSVGAAMHTEVLDAETLRTQAYRNHHHATYDALLAALRLEHATGRL
jgi:outer membrane protein